MANCVRHDEYRKNPEARFCGQCGRSLAEPDLEKLRSPSKLGVVDLAFALTVSIGGFVGGSVSFCDTMKEQGYKPQTYKEVRTLLDNNKDGVIDWEDEKAALIRFGRLYVPIEDKDKK